MFKPRTLALVLVTLMLHLSIQAAPPVFKCTIKGSVTYQREPCPSGEVRNPPTVEQLNAERQKKLQQAGNSTAKTPTAAAGTQAPPSAAAAAGLPAPSTKERTLSTVTPKTSPAVSFKCDGRRYCSQMKSCEEAKYFLANCPGVKMDGDRDGIPCEDQWCHN